MKLVEYHGSMSLEKFWIQWFGPLGRELGTNKPPHRNWTDNPNDLIDYIKMCAIEHEDDEYCRPCWITAQPFRYIKTIEKHGFQRLVGKACAIEKLFFDFDDDTKYCKKCKKYIKKDDFRQDIKEEVFIVETRKGYHVYIFLCQIFEFNANDFDFAKKVYKSLQERFIIGTYEFIDERIIGDINRFARVPMTAHEKNGAICQVLDRNLKPTKIRNLDFYRTYGIREGMISKTIKAVRLRIHKEHQKAEQAIKELEEGYSEGNGFHGTIRPCFQERMDIGEMCHGQRLAWLSEVYYAGYNTEAKMLELCRKTWNDFDETISLQQIQDYFKHRRWEWKPYRCSTIKTKGWCLEDDRCPIWKSGKLRK